MRLSLVIPVIFLCCPLARGQETDARMQKILHPDTNASSNVQGKSFYGGKSFQKTGPAYTRNFTYTEHYSPKGFTTGAYSGSKAYSTDKFSTKEANTKGEYEIPNAAKKADTKTAETKDSSDSKKGYSTRDYETREYRGREAQNLKTKLKGEPEVSSLNPMTVDQVRELLNKNK